MPITLDRIVPWGRSFAEYQQMFALGPRDLAQPILGCADGPASFNAEATARGVHVTSVDPLYRFSRSQIHERILAAYPHLMQQARENAGNFVWTKFGSVEQLGHARMATMELFLNDYDAGRACGRYVAAELPRLPLGDRHFPLALCSHFLFLYSAQLSEEFHVASLLELCRVAAEVRIFPLLSLDGAPSFHEQPVTDVLTRRRFQVSVERVEYEFQRGGNWMLRIRGGS